MTGYVAQARQGPVVYRVAFRRPWVRIDWLEGPEYLKGSALISDGQRAWSRAPRGPWQEGKATPPMIPSSSFSPTSRRCNGTTRCGIPGRKGALALPLGQEDPPKDDRQPAAWRITLNPKGHLPFRYEVLSPSGKVLSQVEYLKLELTPPPQSLFEVRP